MIRVLSELLLSAVVASTVFTGIKQNGAFGELGSELHSYPLALLILLACTVASTQLRSIARHISASQLLNGSLLAGLVALTFLSAGDILANASFKGQFPVKRLVTQTAVLVFYLAGSTSIAFLFRGKREQLFKAVLRGATVGAALSAMYFLVEAPYVLGSNVTLPLINSLSSIYRNPDFHEYSRRMRGLSFEAPSFAIALSGFSAILLPYLVQTRRFVLIGFYILFAFAAVFLTDSRSAAILLMFQLGFVLSLNIEVRARKLVTTGGAIGALAIGIVCLDTILGGGISEKVVQVFESLSIESSDEFHLVSNAGRWGSQYAAIEIAKDSPIHGVGLGQAGFYLPEYYPQWAYESYKVNIWSDGNDPIWPPVFSIYTRLACECGFVGLAFFLAYILVCAVRLWSWRTIRSRHINEGFASFATLFATSLLLFAQFGSFRLVIFWIACAAILTESKSHRDE